MALEQLKQTENVLFGLDEDTLSLLFNIHICTGMEGGNLHSPTAIAGNEEGFLDDLFEPNYLVEGAADERNTERPDDQLQFWGISVEVMESLMALGLLEAMPEDPNRIRIPHLYYDLITLMTLTTEGMDFLNSEPREIGFGSIIMNVDTEEFYIVMDLQTEDGLRIEANRLDSGSEGLSISMNGGTVGMNSHLIVGRIHPITVRELFNRAVHNELGKEISERYQEHLEAAEAKGMVPFDRKSL
jgi:hypothetical protein